MDDGKSISPPRRAGFRLILALLAVLVFFFVGGTFYERKFVTEAGFKTTVDSQNLSAKTFKLDTKKYLLVLSQTNGRRSEGYYIDFDAKKMGYAKYGGQTIKPITESLVMVDREVLDGFRAVEEIDADFQILSETVIITPKGPTELALALDPRAGDIYAQHLICKRTILLKK
jgi:hypothetical protein